MIKKIFPPAFLVLAMIFHGVNAQDNNNFTVSQHIRGGLILGMNASQIDGDDYAGYHKVGINGGFYGQIPVSKIFFFSTEILYSQKGANNPVTPATPTRDYFKWTIQYAEVPILFHFQDKKAFNVGAGFSYSRMVGEQLYATGEPQPPVTICSGKPPASDLIDLHFLCLKKSDYDVLVEANYLPTKHFGINIRFAYSLMPMGYYGGSNWIDRGMRSNLLSFRLMWIFGS